MLHRATPSQPVPGGQPKSCSRPKGSTYCITHGFTRDELANCVWSVLGQSFLKYVFMLRIADNESALVSGGNDEFKALRAGRGGDK